jgi:hypothetical protein
MKTLMALTLLMAAGVSSAAVITSGFVQVRGQLAAGPFTLASDDFSVSGFVSGGRFPTIWLGIPPGTAVNVLGIVSGGDFGGGSGTVNGATVPYVSWGSIVAPGYSGFMFSGPPLVITGTGRVTGSFDFTGRLCGSTYRNCAIDLPALTGSGLVTLTVRAFPSDPPTLDIAEATYVFMVPEPSTFGIVVPLLMIVARRYVRNRPTRVCRDAERQT